MPSFFIKMRHITNFWHPLHSSVPPHHQLSAPAMAPQHKKISGRKGKGSILTHHVCPVCSKDFVSSQGLACHLTSVPYCRQSWLSVSNGLQIDHIVLPANAPSLCPDFGDHSLDDADNDYHPIYATSIDGQDKLASNDDNLVQTNDVMEENSCSDSHVEPPSDVDEGDVVGNTSPYISHPVFPSVEPSSPGKNNNGFTFLPSKSFPENVEDLCFLELAKLIREIGAPLSAFSKILAWMGHWQMEGHTFKTAAFPSYTMYVESLSKRLELDCLKYEMETIIVPWGGPCTFPVFDFPSRFHSLLDDPRCWDNLLIDWEHPSCVPHHKIGLLDDVHSAKWYADTHHMQIQSDSNEVLCGIILFIDQMFTADNDHQGSECPLFTLSILPRHIRNQAWAWHPLGFIPKFESHHSCGQNMQALHLVLTHILSGLCGIQEIGHLTTVVLPPSLSQQITLTFKVPIAFIVGDVKGHDKLCGRYKVHHNIK